MKKSEQTIHDENTTKLGKALRDTVEAIPLGIVKRGDFENEFDKEWKYQTWDEVHMPTEEERDLIWIRYKKYNKKDVDIETYDESFLDNVNIFLTGKDAFFEEWRQIVNSKVKTEILKQSDVTRLAWREYRAKMRKYERMIDDSKFRWYYFENDKKVKFKDHYNTVIELSYILAFKGKKVKHNLLFDDLYFSIDFINMQFILEPKQGHYDIVREHISSE